MRVDEETNTPDSASQVQEAIDMIVQVFDHPDGMSIEYTGDGSEKRTEIEVSTADGDTTYKLVYDGRRDKQEPAFTRLE